MTDDTEAARPRHVRTGEGAPIWAMGSLFEMKLTAGDTAGALGVAQVTQPAGIATPLHRHHNEAEVFVMLEGALLYEADGTLLHALTHRLRCVGARGCRVEHEAEHGGL